MEICGDGIANRIEEAAAYVESENGNVIEEVANYVETEIGNVQKGLRSSFD